MSLLSPRRELDEFRKRYKWMALVAAVTFSLLLVRLVQLQLLQGDYWQNKARENITKTIRYPASRGNITDTKGRILADNKPSYNVLITPSLLRDGDVDKIVTLLNFSKEERVTFESRLARVPERRRTHQLSLLQNISRDQVAILETHSGQLAGVDVIAVPTRQFPFEKLASHTLGYLNEVNAEDMERDIKKVYRVGDRLGRFGVEKAYETELRGKRGYKRVTIKPRGRQAPKDLSGKEKLVEPEAGSTLKLTLDMQLMSILDRHFQRYSSGMSVVVEVKTGKIRALYSKPAFDSNQMSGRLSHQDARALLDDPFRPLVDKTIYETYFPGSTFKPFSAFATLGIGHSPSEREECPGYYEVGRQRMRCTSSHDEVDMHSALVQSCNVYFWKNAEHVGLEKINEYARAFGLGNKTGVGINSEASGFLASREWYKKRFKKFRIGYTLNTSIGQGNTRVTGLQLALAYGAIANGGKLYKPLLVEEVVPTNGTPKTEFVPTIHRDLQSCQSDDPLCINIPAEHFERIQSALRGVVGDQNGTAYNAKRRLSVGMSGKTGTAELTGRRENVPKGREWYFRRSHAWFAGYAPSDDPELAIVVLVEHGGAGGKAAAPIGLESLNEYFILEASRPNAEGKPDA